jgi:hypothetical protein
MPIKFKAMLPTYYDEAAFVAAAERILDKTGKDFRAGFEQSVEGWEHQVSFATQSQIEGKRARVIVGTNDEIYGYVNHGTKPHEIKPKRKGRLSFRTGYRAKTQRGSLRSGSGGATGAWVSAKKVQHPGTEPRNFDEEVVRRTKPKFERYCSEEFDNAALKRRARP